MTFKGKISVDITPFLGKPESVKGWIDKCISNRGLGFWLVYEDTPQNDDIQLTTTLLPIVGNTNNFSDQEFDEFENSLFKSGYCYFLNMDQIEDVIDNYTMQKAQWTDSELLEAILFYFERDAFICL
nr:hypothetical protein [Shewanella sp. KJ2020]